MFRVMATLVHDELEPAYTYAEEVFNSKEEAESWINGKEGYLFAQDVMIGVDVHEYLDGYLLEGLTAETAPLDKVGISPSVTFGE
jgi:hypothetical protein